MLTDLSPRNLAERLDAMGTPVGRDATSILLTCDGGGSNSSRKYIFKHDLERLSNAIGLPIRVAHYPPYCSKYNPIERRFFGSSRFSARSR